jgi:AmpD protein
MGYQQSAPPPSAPGPVDPDTGLVAGVRYAASPNYDARPLGVSVNVLVIHAISLPPNQFGGPEVEDFFCGHLDVAAHPYFKTIADLRVSAHFLIRRDGEIIQFVPVHERAWHAGESRCEGRTRVNDFSIGIELEGSDDVPFEDAQYGALAELTAVLREAYPRITPDRILGHADVAPGRKTDPGPWFDWPRYRQLCA